MHRWGWLGPVFMLLTLPAATSCGGRTALWETNREVAGSGFMAGGGGGVGGGASANAGGGSAPTAGASGADDGMGGASPAWIVVGDDQLIDVFISRVGVYVVTDQALLLYRRNGELARTLPSKSRNSSAAFDGEYLSVASEDSLIVSYTLDLNSLFVTQTKLPCASLAMVSGHHAVCTAADDINRSVYDVLGGANVATVNFGYFGVPTSRVPGADAVVTFADMATAGYPQLSLFRVEPNYLLTLLGSTRGPVISRVFGFSGLPATELVTDSGLVLDLYDTSCGGKACFTPNGQLPIEANQRYLAFDTIDTKRTLALLEDDTTIPSGTGENDLKSYEIRTLDVAARSSVRFEYYRARIGGVVAMRHNERGASVVLGTHLAAQTSGPGYYLLNLPYRE